MYSVREDWRVLYEKPQGLANSSGIDKLSGAKQSFNPKQYKTEDNGTTTNPALAKVPASENERYNMVRSAQTKQIRSDFWHEYIEERNESGVSAFVTDKTLGTTGGPAFSFFNTEQLLNDGLVRDNRDIYWLGEYNPTFNNSDN